MIDPSPFATLSSSTPILPLRRLGRAAVVIAVSLAATAAAAGPAADLWIDGPDPVQPGVDREFPAATVDAWGRPIHVWQAFTPGDVRNDIYLRRFTIAGTPLADPVIVNTYTDNDQMAPRVAAAADGSFLVVWRSREPGPIPTDPLGYWVRSRLFDAGGNPVGGEQYVNTADAAIAGGDLRVDVAAQAGGGYVVVWRSAAGGTDPGIGILARRISAAGVPVASPFQVNVTESQSQHHCAVAPLADGGFVVAWTVPGVAMRRFGANGTPVGGQLDVNLAAANGLATGLAVTADGRVAVVWQEGGSEIRARLYDSTLTPLGAEFLVSDPLDTDPDAPRVAGYGTLGFVVVWESSTGIGSDSDGLSVQARIVTGVDQFTGPQIQLNDYEPGHQHEPDVGADGFRTVFAWHSAGGNPLEPGDDSILGHLEDLCGGIFCDDFELGTTLRWSATVP